MQDTELWTTKLNWLDGKAHTLVGENAYSEADKLIKNDELVEGTEERSIRGLIQSQEPKVLR